MPVQINLNSTNRYTSNEIASEQFGANFLFNRESFAEGIGSNGGFDEVAASLGVQHLRYPGGAIAEMQFDLNNPENTHQAFDLITGEPLPNVAKHDLTPMTTFLASADAMGAKVTLVLPSARYDGNPMQAAIDVATFVRDVLDGPFGHVVEAFELGNEWASHFSSPAAYGEVANAMALAADMTAATTAFDPMIAIQASARAARLHETDAIIDALSPQSLAAIDAVILHDYRPEPWTQRDVSAQKTDHVARFEAAAGRELKTIVTEWNVGNASENDGLLQGAGILDLFHTHLVNGVDQAFIWPVLENNTTRLAGDIDPDDPDAGTHLMIGGEVFRQMAQSVEGTRALNFAPDFDLDANGTTDVLIHGYEDASRLVVFVSSLSATPLVEEVDFADMGDLAGNFDEFWVTRITVGEGVDPLDHLATPVVEQVASDLTDSMSFELAPYQIMRLEFAAHSSDHLKIDTEALDTLRGTSLSEIFVLGDDGQRDLIRSFNPETDRIDVSAFGATDFEELSLNSLMRRDGSVSWIELQDQDGQSEALIRFDAGDLDVARLSAQNFIFASDASAVSGFATVPDGSGRQDLRGTDVAEIFVMQDDGARDLVRGFEDGVDQINVSAFAANFDDLTIRNLERRDGSTSWVEISDTDGDAELILRFSDNVHDADRLAADDFIF